METFTAHQTKFTTLKSNLDFFTMRKVNKLYLTDISRYKRVQKSFYKHVLIFIGHIKKEVLNLSRNYNKTIGWLTYTVTPSLKLYW